MILLTLWGCLPHKAVSQQGELEAVVYELRMADAAPDAPPLRVTKQFARSFPDGTNGWLVCVEEGGWCAELRAFDTGEIVQLRGAGAWPAAERARLAAVWPLLAPHLDRDADLLTGWPVGPVTHASLRVLGRGGWRAEAGGWRWTPTVVAQGLSAVALTGRIDAAIHLDREELQNASWKAELPWCVVGGACVDWSSAGSLARVGTQAPRRLHPCPQRGEDLGRAPLCGESEVAIEDPDGGLDLGSFLGAGLGAPKTGTVSGEAAP